MKHFPQLRVRTEYSYRTSYGSPGRVAEVLAENGCPAAGCVDTIGTWGHVVWEKALTAAGVVPLYGTEFTVPEGVAKPKAWVLAEDIAAFYRFSSANPDVEEGFVGAEGVIRFAGAALKNPDAFDYVDLNPSSVRQIRASLALAKATKKPIVLTSDNDYPAPSDERLFLAWDDSKRMTPQHLLTLPEIEQVFRPYLNKAQYHRALKSTYEAAERASGITLPAAPIIKVAGDLRVRVEEGRRYRLQQRHLAAWSQEYEDRLQRELRMIEEKDYASYFLVVADLVVWAKQHMLVGPARGSSAGSLVCYLLRITEVDPLVHGLIFERFIDVNRDDLPDIDIDFNDQKREMVFDYLREKYGAENVARIGSVSRLKARSVMAHVGKKLAIPHGATFGVANVLIEYSSGDARYGKGLEDTLENTQPGRDLLKLYPEAALMGELENHASHSGVHAAGIIVSTVPVVEYCTVRDGIAHIDKRDAERLNMLKIDALGLRTLGVIEDAGVVDSEFLYGLKHDEQACFDIFNQQKFSGVFQFEGPAQRQVSTQIPVVSFQQIDHITALARPGPLGGGGADHYIKRNAGAEVITYLHESMKGYLGETMGVVLYQEQVMRIVRELGRMSWEDTSSIRKTMSASKGEEYFASFGKRFIEGAKKTGLEEAIATELWKELCSHGAWSMNKSHTVSYAMISYWCAYMKAHHPLEYAAACLRNAKDDEQIVEILREVIKEGVLYTPFDADTSQATWSAGEGTLLGGFTNLVGIGKVKAAQYVKKRDSEAGLTDKDRETLAKYPIKNGDLRPAHTKWGKYYDNPALLNVHGTIKEFDTLEDRESGVVICRLVRVERRDENEAVRVSKRGGKRLPGQQLFLDAFVVDDSVSRPIRIRLRPKDWFALGVKLADRAVPGEDWFLVRGRWLGQFTMMTVERIKCLTNPEIFL